MLTIRKEQMAIFGEVYREKIVEYVRESAPEVHKTDGDEGVRKLAELAMAKSEQYGIVRCSDICRYIAFMMILGTGFDTDPQCHWASEILRDDELAGQEKIAQLLETFKTR